MTEKTYEQQCNEKMAVAKEQHDDSICFYKTPCSNLVPDLFPKRPCFQCSKWMTKTCRARFLLDGTDKAGDEFNALESKKVAIKDNSSMEKSE